MIDTRLCTCHPDDNPPIPCARQYAFEECVAAANKQEKQMTEPKVVRRNPRFGSALPSDQLNWDVPIVEYIRADKLDKWAAVALGIAVLVVVALDSAWLMGRLK